MAMTVVEKPRTDLKRPATAHTEDVVSTSTSSNYHSQRTPVDQALLLQWHSSCLLVGAFIAESSHSTHFASCFRHLMCVCELLKFRNLDVLLSSFVVALQCLHTHHKTLPSKRPDLQEHPFDRLVVIRNLLMQHWLVHLPRLNILHHELRRGRHVNLEVGSLAGSPTGIWTSSMISSTTTFSTAFTDVSLSSAGVHAQQHPKQDSEEAEAARKSGALAITSAELRTPGRVEAHPFDFLEPSNPPHPRSNLGRDVIRASNRLRLDYIERKANIGYSRDSSPSEAHSEFTTDVDFDDGLERYVGLRAYNQRIIKTAMYMKYELRFPRVPTDPPAGADGEQRPRQGDSVCLFDFQWIK
eukprot:6490839-Amphidinium_carterae.1